jgi:hypothetical protein
MSYSCRIAYLSRMIQGFREHDEPSTACSSPMTKVGLSSEERPSSSAEAVMWARPHDRYITRIYAMSLVYSAIHSTYTLCATADAAVAHHSRHTDAVHGTPKCCLPVTGMWMPRQS